MAKKSSMDLSFDDIYIFFKSDPRYVFSYLEINEIFKSNFSNWKLVISTKLSSFISFLISKDIIHPEKILSKVVYVKKGQSVYEVLLSLKPKLFFSHYSAMRFHSLTEQTPNSFYLSSKRKIIPSELELSQSSIDLAFSKESRKKYSAGEYKKKNVYILDNVCMDIDTVTIELNEADRVIPIRVTNLEKTLLDAVIRPYYCGGISEVVKAFDNAKDEISINKILAIINRNKYQYPYVQNIGFYLEYVGYDNKHISKLKEKVSKFDFYLDHNMGNKIYSKEWKIYYPAYL